MRDLITVGDRTSHGGLVISGDSTSLINGKAMARVGDKCTCPIRGHGGVTTIVTGDANMAINGQAAARVGDYTACGATLISTQHFVTTGGAGGFSAPAETPISAENSFCEKHTYDQSFQLFDEITHHPLVGKKYKLTFSGGVVEGVTDENGSTQKVSAAKPEQVQIEIL